MLDQEGRVFDLKYLSRKRLSLASCNDITSKIVSLK